MILWLNDNSGFAIAALTLVYVVATFLILFSNRKSTKTANEQLKEMKEQFYEEFRPILTAEAKTWDSNKITFQITNIGNRAAKNILLEYLIQVNKPAGKELVMKGQKKHEVLADNRLLQPQKSLEYVLEDYDTTITNTIDVILFYESYNKKYEERICVHSNRSDNARIRSLG